MFDVRPGSVPFARVRDFFHGFDVRRFECQHSGRLADYPSAETIVQEYPRITSLSARPLYIELHTDDSDTTLHIRRAFWDALFLLDDPRVFAHLRHLTTNEYFWPQDGSLPPVASLSGYFASHIMIMVGRYHRADSCAHSASERPADDDGGVLPGRMHVYGDRCAALGGPTEQRWARAFLCERRN